MDSGAATLLSGSWVTLSLPGSVLEAPPWGAERGVGVLAARASDGFLTTGFSGDVSSMFTLYGAEEVLKSHWCMFFGGRTSNLEEPRCHKAGYRRNIHLDRSNGMVGGRSTAASAAGRDLLGALHESGHLQRQLKRCKVKETYT